MKAFFTGILCLFASFSYGQMIKMGGLTSSRYDIHIVEKGETLYSISKSFNTTVGELMKLNPEIHGNQLEEGQIINVPVSKVVLNDDSFPNEILSAIPAGATASLKEEGKEAGSECEVLPAHIP